jgi:hypothetical protein
MKKFLIAIFVVVGFFASLYFWDQKNKREKQHPEIHIQAGKPDNYLLEAMHYEGEHRHTKSAIKIEQAIQAIWKLEKDVDDKSFDRLEETIKKLEMVHRKIIRDSIPYDELLSTLEYALGNLAHVELEVAAKYSASNQTIESRTAIKYAKLHLKNILVLHNPNVMDDSSLLASEIQLLDQIDSLLSQKNLSQAEYSASLDKMIKEVDDILARIEED